ncbi:hypothetical protein PAECIP111893_02369 [Paenibacillus plantiphilus]|uniref:Holin n=1 Tax=Paenibacillus plantiphilus TaxID=2905650 RepID=A0ABN8GCL3_9BACL|nr:hypothetical protein [Paenibacillus plantiphilus]CAH1205551.1 hypothetical protein PAECIP111893_02369 [Paenibacillus plantiphilus]
MDKLRNINKAILLPLLAAIAAFIKQSFGYEISDELLNTIADISLFIVMIIGLFIKPTKPKDESSSGETYH